MPAYPRSKYVHNGEIETFHAWSRCVQRAYLCGDDPFTGLNFDYRRDWIEQLFKYQAGVFAVDLCNYGILSNHEHLIVRTRPDISRGWSAEEVAWRWKMAWPTWDEDQGWVCQPNDEDLRRLLAQTDKVAAARCNLASLSWFMARVKEPIARLANAEMQRSGHFWEQRFKCRRLEDEPAVLTGSIYVDVNQMAAGMAASLETSRCSAIRLRLKQWCAKEAQLSVEKFHTDDRPDLQLEISVMERLLDGAFLAPISDQGPLLNVADLGSLKTPSAPASSDERDGPANTNSESPESAETVDELEWPRNLLTGSDAFHPSAVPSQLCENESRESAEASMIQEERTAIRLSRDERSSAPLTYEIHRRQKARQRPRASDNPFLGLPSEQYCDLVTWTAAKVIGLNTHATMPTAISELLTRMGVVAEAWLAMMASFATMFRVTVGKAQNVSRFLNRSHRKRCHGIRACRSSFT